MKIKRFQATTMREAMRLVREEQGADAVILSSRRVPGGVEVVAATDYDAALMHSAARQRADSSPESDPPPPATQAITPSVRPKTQVIASRLTPHASHAESQPPPMRAEAEREAAQNSPVTAMAAAAGIEAAEQLNREIQTLRSLLEEQLAGLRWGDMQKHRPRQAAALRALANLGLDPELARSIAEELPEASDPERARFLPLGLLSRRLSVDASDPILQGGVVALVGPTGVGKTTTIAKLAARYASAHGVRDIALVTTDQYRIGAQEQLFMYGRLLGVPVHAVSAQDTLPAVLSRVADRGLVLIDTAGLSQRDKALVTQCQQLKMIGNRLKTWLVLAANAQPGAQHDIVERFGGLTLDACVLTKIDEAHRLGGALSVTMRHGLRVNYLANGQRVPEDLQPARADRLVLHATQLARQSEAPVDESFLISSFTQAAQAHAL